MIYTMYHKSEALLFLWMMQNCSDRNIKILFQKANTEIKIFFEWFKANKPWDDDILPLRLTSAVN